MKKIVLFIGVLAIIGGVLTACSTKVATETTFALTGAVEANWTESDLKSLDIKSVDFVEKDGETTTYEGVSILSLLDAAGVEEYESCTFVAADGYTADVTGEELDACEDCVLAFQDEGGLLAVMPGFSGNLQVKDIIEIQVQ